MRERMIQSFVCSAALLIGVGCNNNAAGTAGDGVPAASGQGGNAAQGGGANVDMKVPDLVQPGRASTAPSGTQDVVVEYLGEGVPGPRMAEIFVRHGGGLEFAGVDRMDAVLNASKDVVAKVQPNGLVRLVVYSSGNLNRLPAGRWLTLHFNQVGSGSSNVELAYDRTAFAPADVTPGPTNLRVVTNAQGDAP